MCVIRDGLCFVAVCWVLRLSVLAVCCCVLLFFVVRFACVCLNV